MAAKLQRYLKKQIDAGTVDLPDELSFLTGFGFHAIAEQRVQYERGWYVELKGSSLKALLDSKKKLNAARRSNRDQSAQLIRLQEEKVALAKSRDGSVALKVERDEALEKLLVKQTENEILVGNAVQLEVQILDLQAEVAALSEANEQLMKNIEEDNQPSGYVKSPKTSAALMEERENVLRGLALQGGKAGGGKR